MRVIDALAVHKDAVGEIEVAHLSNLSMDEAIELGTKVGALIGLGIEGEEGMEAGAEAGAEAVGDGVQVFSDEDAWDVLEDIPNDSAAALILLEHHWAVPLRDADRPRRGLPHQRRLHQPARPDRDRLDLPRGGRGAARDGDGRRRGREMTATTGGMKHDGKPSSRAPHGAPYRPPRRQAQVGVAGDVTFRAARPGPPIEGGRASPLHRAEPDRHLGCRPRR